MHSHLTTKLHLHVYKEHRAKQNIFHDIMNVFPAILDQFNAPLMEKKLNI